MRDSVTSSVDVSVTVRHIHFTLVHSVWLCIRNLHPDSYLSVWDSFALLIHWAKSPVMPTCHDSGVCCHGNPRPHCDLCWKTRSVSHNPAVNWLTSPFMWFEVFFWWPSPNDPELLVMNRCNLIKICLLELSRMSIVVRVLRLSISLFDIHRGFLCYRTSLQLFLSSYSYVRFPRIVQHPFRVSCTARVHARTSVFLHLIPHVAAVVPYKELCGTVSAMHIQTGWIFTLVCGCVYVVNWSGSSRAT